MGREGFTDKSIEYGRRKKKGDSPRAHITEKEVFWVCSPVPHEVEAERLQFQGARATESSKPTWVTQQESVSK